MAKEILTPKTGADQSDTFYVHQAKSSIHGYVGDLFPVRVTADNLATSEEAHLEQEVNGTWMDVQDSDGSQMKLVAPGQTGATKIEIFSPGKFRVHKDSTASVCGIYLHTPSDP